MRVLGQQWLVLGECMILICCVGRVNQCFHSGRNRVKERFPDQGMTPQVGARMIGTRPSSSQTLALFLIIVLSSRWLV